MNSTTSLALLSLLTTAVSAFSGDRQPSYRMVYNQPAMLIQNGGCVYDVTNPPDKTLTAAVGNGIADDTKALKDAFTYVMDITEITGTRAKNSYIIHLPDGTYKVTDTITYHGPTRFPKKYKNRTEEAFRLRFIGESRDGTVIKLPDSTKGFTDPNSPKTVLQLARPECLFNNANACNYIRNLTVDTGSNAGAVGIDMWGANNTGIQNIAVTAAAKSGMIGIHFRITVLAGYFQDISVQGFKTGIHIDVTAHAKDVRGRASHPVFEYITCRNQTETGLKLDTCSVTLRNYHSINSIPAIQLSHDESQLILLDSRLEGKDSKDSAINITGTGHLYARNIQVSGYRSGISNTAEAAENITEYSNYPIVTAGKNKQSFHLTIEEIPEYFFEETLSKWISPANTSSASIQAAMNSGKSTVYFPEPKTYSPSSVNIPASVKCINGMFQKIKGTVIISEPSESPLFILDTTHLNIENKTERTIVVLNSNWGYLENNDIPGIWHLACTDQTDVSRLSNTTVYGRFINAEGKRFLTIDNNKWVQMGHKAERQKEPCIRIKGKSIAEIFGATIGVKMNGPALSIESNSRVTFIGSNSADYSYSDAIENNGNSVLSTSAFANRRSNRKFFIFRTSGEGGMAE